MNELSWISAQYCARHDAAAFLVLWGLLLVLCGAAAATVFIARPLDKRRKFAARVCAGVLLLFALLTAILGVSIFYGCSATAANEQGLPSHLAARTFTFLRCLGTDAVSMVPGWALLVGSSSIAMALVVLGVFRRRAVIRVPAFSAAALLLMLAFACGFLLLLRFSWCQSERLI